VRRDIDFPLSHKGSPRHFPAVRVPIPVVLLLILAVVGGTWWKNTRHMDFITPPTQARLEATRLKAEASLPRVERVKDAISIPKLVKAEEPPPVEPPKPVIDLGDLTTPPTLQSYGELSPKGAAHLIEHATALEEKDEAQRALLVWERVIDLTKPDASQAATAISAIKRLRSRLPIWNAKPEGAIPITLNASTSKKQAKTFAPILEAIARDIERASSGIVKIKTTMKVGKASTKNPPPIALWLAGSDKKSTSTEILSFTVDSPEALRNSLLKTTYQLVINHLARATAYTPPTALTPTENPQEALVSRITRLCWSEFATAMNEPAKKSP
jgi:hypothetical protein